MENNSRLITYPSQVEKKNHTVLIVDIDNADIENIGLFCMSSQKDYDIYLYDEEIQDLSWLAAVSQNIDHALINSKSKVEISGIDHMTVYGDSNAINSPLKYFIDFDKIGID